MRLDNLAQDILGELKQTPVAKRDRHRYLAEYFLPKPSPSPRPKTFTPQAEAMLGVLKRMPYMVAIDPASAKLLRPTAYPYLLKVSGWVYLGLHNFDHIPLELIPDKAQAFVLHSPYQLVIMPLEYPLYGLGYSDLYVQRLHYPDSSRIILIITRTLAGLEITDGQKETLSSTA